MSLAHLLNTYSGLAGTDLLLECTSSANAPAAAVEWSGDMAAAVRAATEWPGAVFLS